MNSIPRSSLTSSTKVFLVRLMQMNILKNTLITFTAIWCCAFSLFAGSTGKLAGNVNDVSTKDALIGVTILIEGTTYGAATDIEGSYVILNVPPGTYTLRASAVGYHPSRISEVKVSVDQTTRIDFHIAQATIELKEEVVIIAQRPIVQRDLTSSSNKVSSDQIKAFPVEDVAGLVNLQAGVVNGHFRGGRSGEVLYLIDGVPVTDAYSGGAGVLAENNSIQELEVISGTFNAEYGQAMSGVVNQVTKDGGEKFSGEVSVYFGDYVSGRKIPFENIKTVQPSGVYHYQDFETSQKNIGNTVRPTDIYNVQGSLSGPVVGIPEMTFFLSGRVYNNDGYLYGKRIFSPTDLSDFSNDSTSRWIIRATGDGKFVPMNFEKRSTLQGKLTLRLFGSDRLRVQFLHQQRDYNDYDQRYKYDPDGNYEHFTSGDLGSVSYTNVFNATTFLEANGAWFNNRDQSYVYQSPTDPRFPDYTRKLAVSGSSFYTGGAEDLSLHRESRYLSLKADLVSQINKEHQVKGGVELKQHRIWIHNFGIEDDPNTNFQPQPVEFGRSEFAHTIIRPVQYSGYVQDKMEFDDLIVNAGVRFDYFNSQAKVLVRQLLLRENKELKAASPESQISPRVGLAFPITDRGVLHLSYGHFFQIPQFDMMFLNPKYNINATEAFQVGNPDLKSQRTVAYELGLQQQLTEEIGLDVTGFYKDVRNLIGSEIFDIGNGNKYAQFVNRDYGNTRGFILSLEKRHSNGFSATLDYTFQIAKGNSSDPNSVFLDNQTNPPRESQKQLAPLDWDRRHSLNATATVGTLNDFTVTMIGRLGSGLPYTPAFQNQRTGLVNSENRQMVVSVDLYVVKYVQLSGFAVNIFAKVYNLFDTESELDVFSDTGRAGYSLETNYIGTPRGINSIQEYYTRPDFYAAPREIVVGAGFSF